MSSYNRSLVKAGTIMGYTGSGVYGWLTTKKTWMNIGHVEMCIDPVGGMSVAARLQGVNEYPIREDSHLCVLLEPDGPLDLAAGMDWFHREAQGLDYDLFGQVAFWRIGSGAKNKMWCSEFLDELLRHCGFYAFNPMCNPAKIAPAQFLQTGKLRTAWCTEDAFKARGLRRI